MTCLITGADGGLGPYVCSALWHQGWHLHAAVADAAAADRFRSHAGQFPYSLTQADLTQAEATARWVKEALNPPQTVVHLVGGWRSSPNLADTTDADFDYLVALNLRTTFQVLKATLPLLKRQGGGSIVLVSARTGLRPTAQDALYGALKAGVAQLARAAAEEGRPHQVRVNAVAPGVIRNPALQSWATPEQLASFTPPEAIAEAIGWLVSPAAAGVTGTIVPLYGGLEG